MHPAEDPTTRFLSRPGGRIAYDVRGEGHLVVCVPGMGELRSSYRFLTPALVEAGYRVATMDLRGHGDSDTTFDTYDDVAAGSDVVALIEELGGVAAVVGNSMGAGAAAWAAAEAPGRVAGLILIGPFVRQARTSPTQRQKHRWWPSGCMPRSSWSLMPDTTRRPSTPRSYLQWWPG
ncbi:MAG: alpha/beta hydrolase, partial [Gemmatimonadota bacterium]